MTMSHCPKCHSGSISRPVYQEAGPYTPECLVYYCLNCGYSKPGPCKDAPDNVTPFQVYTNEEVTEK